MTSSGFHSCSRTSSCRSSRSSGSNNILSQFLQVLFDDGVHSPVDIPKLANVAVVGINGQGQFSAAVKTTSSVSLVHNLKNKILSAIQYFDDIDIQQRKGARGYHGVFRGQRLKERDESNVLGNVVEIFLGDVTAKTILT